MAEEEEVLLFGLCRSPYTFRAQLALKLKGVNYKYVEDNPSKRTPHFLKYNSLHDKLPLLVHNGFPVSESLTIVEYIDEAFKQGSSILPQDPRDRAVARFWTKFIDEKCMAVLMKLLKQKEGEEEAKEVFTVLENGIKGKKVFGGDEVGIVDITLLSVTYWLRILQGFMGLDILSPEKFPKLCEWTDELVNITVVKECLPSEDYVSDIIRARQSPAKVDSKLQAK